MSSLFDLVQTLIVHLLGGSVGTGSSATTIAFKDSWVGQIAKAIVNDADATDGTGVIAIFFVFSLLMAGFKLVHSLKRI